MLDKLPAVTGGAIDDDLDTDLLSRHLAGDAEAFTEIVRRHRDHL
ncbi:MAG: hypothetical protein QOJ62_1403, partial [Actinomycetota bacterium]|nr:hypothetical protein [Actinomycetota bacterium]